MTGDHERLVDAAVVHDAEPALELDPRVRFGVHVAFLEVAAERVEGAADVVVDVEDVEAGELVDHRASSGQSSSAVPPSTSAAVALRQVAARPLGQRDQVGVGAIVRLRIVGSPDEPFRAELAHETVDDLTGVALRFRRFEQVRRDLEVQVGVLDEANSAAACG